MVGYNGCYAKFPGPLYFFEGCYAAIYGDQGLNSAGMELLDFLGVQPIAPAPVRNDRDNVSLRALFEKKGQQGCGADAVHVIIAPYRDFFVLINKPTNDVCCRFNSGPL